MITLRTNTGLFEESPCIAPSLTVFFLCDVIFLWFVVL